MHNQITLIPFSPAHIEHTYAWVTDPELRRQFLIRGEVTPDGHREYFRDVMADSTQRVFAILADGRHVGNCGLKHISPLFRQAELWIYIGEETLRNQGIGKLATNLLIKEAETCLALKTLFLHVVDFNEAARQLYSSLGFIETPMNDPEDEWSGRGCSVVRMERSLSTRDVAMMQPAFLPWQGFFELIWMADVFILLDDFQFSVQSWNQRNQLFTNKNQVGWYTVPVKKSFSFRSSLNKTIINESTPWRKKMWKRLVQNYSQSPFFHETAPYIKNWLMNPADSLATQNISFIKLVCKVLGIKREFRLSSMHPSNLKRSERVLELLRWCNAERYFCAKNSFEYMFEDGVFPTNGIKVLFQDFQAMPYSQIGSTDRFVPFLSVLDTLMNVGPSETNILIKKGTPKWHTWDERLQLLD